LLPAPAGPNSPPWSTRIGIATGSCGLRAVATRPIPAVTAGRAGGAPRLRDTRAGGWCRDRTGASAPRCDTVRWRTRSADGTRSQTAAPAARATRP
jgi:hypothetical protein